MFALAQAAPGPNMMVVTLVGWHVAGWPGVIVTSIAKFGPSSILTGITLHYWRRFKDEPWRGIVQAGLVPVTVGLVAASASLITEASVHALILGAITLGLRRGYVENPITSIMVFGCGCVSWIDWVWSVISKILVKLRAWIKNSRVAYWEKCDGFLR